MLRSTCSWVSEKKPSIIDTSWNRVTSAPTPNCHSNRNQMYIAIPSIANRIASAPSWASSSDTLPDTLSPADTLAPGYSRGEQRADLARPPRWRRRRGHRAWAGGSGRCGRRRTPGCWRRRPQASRSGRAIARYRPAWRRSCGRPARRRSRCRGSVRAPRPARGWRAVATIDRISATLRQRMKSMLVSSGTSLRRRMRRS